MPCRFFPLAGLLISFLAATATGTEPPGWEALTPGLWRVAGNGNSYVLKTSQGPIVLGAPANVDRQALNSLGLSGPALALLTHGHRDASAGCEGWVAAGGTVRAPRESSRWIEPEGVEDFWNASLPPRLDGEFPPLFHRQWAVWAYHVRAVGTTDVRCDLSDGDVIETHDWTIRVLATPGHSPDHVAYLATPRPSDDRRWLFCGDSFFAPGQLWTPYTTDWHHATDAGLVAAASSIRRLAAERPTLLLPEHGAPLQNDIQAALSTTAERLQQLAELKSFETFRQRTAPDTPVPAFLAFEQVGTATPAGNTQPWSRLASRFYMTGNTYALISRSGGLLLVDPYDRGLTDRLAELRKLEPFDTVEVALVTHAHNDHYTGIFALQHERAMQVWTLDRIADVISDPARYRAPYVDPRPVDVARRLATGETVEWHEYRLNFEHQPGQTEFAMSIGIEVDGRKALFTGDNFYRADQYSGSGGWSGLNRGLPRGYVASIARLLALSPDWILTEHGGAMRFEPADFELRGRWAASASQLCDNVSPSGDQRLDWNPHRLRCEPLRRVAYAGERVSGEFVIENPLDVEQQLSLTSDSPACALLKPRTVLIPAGSTIRVPLVVELDQQTPAGRRIVTFSAHGKSGSDPADLFWVLEVKQDR